MNSQLYNFSTNINYKNRNMDRAAYVSASLPQLAKLLNQAASEGKVKEVAKLLSNGASVHAFGPVGMNPLHLAAEKGHYKVCEILLNAGVVVDSKNKVGKTVLHLAAVNGHSHIVLQLLSLGIDVDSCDMLDMTPLHWACDRGHASVVKLLLSYDADPSRLNKFQKTPLQLAIEKQHSRVVLLIQNKRKMTEVKSASDCSSLHGQSADDEDTLSQPSSSFYWDDLTSGYDEAEIFSEEFTPRVQNEEVVGPDDIEDITNQVQKDLLYEDSGSPQEPIEVDEESAVQDNLLNALNKLQDYASLKNNSREELGEMDAMKATELLRAQAALVSLEDPSRMLRRAIYYGHTIQLTEAGQRALAMIKPDPFIIPSEDAKEKESEEEDNRRTSPGGTSLIRSRQSSGSSECSAVVLRSQPFQDLVNGLSSCSTTTTAAAAKSSNTRPVKRYRIL